MVEVLRKKLNQWSETTSFEILEQHSIVLKLSIIFNK